MDICTESEKIADVVEKVKFEVSKVQTVDLLPDDSENGTGNELAMDKENVVADEEEQKPSNENEIDAGSTSGKVVAEPSGLKATDAVSSESVEEERVVKEQETVVQNEDYYLQVLGQYLQCVRNKESHSTFLQDPVTGPFLSLCLASNSDKVLISVLKVINVLLKNRDNILRLKDLLHFTDALLATSRNEDIHVAIRTKAGSFYDLIKNMKMPLRTNLDSSNMDKADNCLPEPAKPLMNSAKEIQFHINHTLNKERRFVITRALVRIDGIISVAFNPDHRLCIIRARRVKPEALGVIVANLGFECSLITRNEKREILRIPIKPEVKHGDAETSNNKNRENEKPFYFPEEEDEEEPGANAVALKGFNENSGADGGWWNSAKKFAKKSLFW